MATDGSNGNGSNNSGTVGNSGGNAGDSGANGGAGTGRKRPKHENTEAELLVSGKKVISVFPRIAAALPKAIDVKTLSGSVTSLETSITDVAEATNARTRAVATKKARRKNLDQYIKRIRSSVKGHFGADSEEYELVGGTPVSKRKKRPRK